MSLLIMSGFFLLVISFMVYVMLQCTRLTLTKNNRDGVDALIERRLLGLFTVGFDKYEEVKKFYYEADGYGEYALAIQYKNGSHRLTGEVFEGKDKKLLSRLNAYTNSDAHTPAEQVFRIDYGSLIFRVLFFAPFFIGILAWFLYSLASVFGAEEKIIESVATHILGSIASDSTPPEHFPTDAYWPAFCTFTNHQDKSDTRQYDSWGNTHLSLTEIKRKMQQANFGGWQLQDVIKQEDVLSGSYAKGGQELSYTFYKESSGTSCIISLKVLD